MAIQPKYKWKQTFQAIPSDKKEYHEHNGKKFTVLEDITDPAVKDAEGYGYIRVYNIQLEDGTKIDALECEVEEFPET